MREHVPMRGECPGLNFSFDHNFLIGRVRVVTHNPPRVVTPISPCDISVINKKAHGRKCWLCLWISSIGERVTKLVFPAGQFSR